MAQFFSLTILIKLVTSYYFDILKFLTFFLSNKEILLYVETIGLKAN